MKTKHESLSNDVQEGALAKFGIGQPMSRIEDRRFIRGEGRYVDDDDETGLLHAAFLRSPHAHAEIRSIDTSAARSAPGVIAVYTGADWQSAGFSGLPLRPTIKQADGSPIASAPRQGLAIGRVRHVGECVAMIVAGTARQALRRAGGHRCSIRDRSIVSWRRGRHWTATRPGSGPTTAPAISCFLWRVGDAEKTAQALAGAAQIVTLDLVNNRLVPNSMETRGVMVRRDPGPAN